MDFFLQVPDEQKLPPEDVHLQALKISPDRDGRKVKLSLVLSPFKVRPNVELTIFDASGQEVAHTSILETMLHKMDLYMHLRAPTPGGQYRIEIKIYYQRLPEPSETQVDVPIPEPLIVDHHEASFYLPLRET